MRVVFKNILIGASLCFISLSAFFSSSLAQNALPSLVQKGEYLSKAADCMACHRATDPSGKPFQGGLAISTPMGNIISSNITPSKKAGIGEYSLEDFSNAVRKGIRKDGTNLYPGMPYTAFSRINDDDIKALYSYFMLGVEPVDIKPEQETNLAFPFNIRTLMIGWNILYGQGASIKLPDNASQELKRGQYLVDGLGHCGTCHTPRNTLMAEDSAKYLSSGYADQWRAPNITSDDISGIGGWSEKEIIAYLKGQNVAEKGGAAGVMAEAINHSLRYLSEEDITSIAVYLKNVPAINNPEQTMPAYEYDGKELALSEIEYGNQKNPRGFTTADTTNGAFLYNSVCASCHGINGQGTQDGFYPSLTHNATVGMDDPRNLIGVIRLGVDRYDGDRRVFMPSASYHPLNDDQIIAVANYVRGHFGDGSQTITYETLKTIEKGIPSSFLIKNAAWLFVGAIVIAILIIIAILRRIFLKRNSV
ncbi:cytochrome c [Bartonella tamiae]|uniref:Cytochrome c domain-containing protein n=1 Tax=Bartonella tamiae Th239 TaxID=1094558 RepID=J1JWG2_9HYPH|nr:cytochrome c [Bartonella tamiae]EJF88900.1 hypothetical protein ME5_01451 [Bartonella tamiae Th239]EJF94850.1 hypothetical protein MEG_00431 [Bartonella tamiae Th307]